MRPTVRTASGAGAEELTALLRSTGGAFLDQQGYPPARWRSNRCFPRARAGPGERMAGCHRTHEGGIGFSRRRQVEAVSGNSDSPPLPPLAGLLQGLSPEAPPASLVGIGAGLARIRRAGFGEAGVDAFGLTLRFDSPARVRSSIVASGASFLMERIPAMADALASYASEVAITCPLGERRTKRNFPVVPFLITNLPGISAPFLPLG